MVGADPWINKSWTPGQAAPGDRSRLSFLGNNGGLAVLVSAVANKLKMRRRS